MESNKPGVRRRLLEQASTFALMLYINLGLSLASSAYEVGNSPCALDDDDREIPGDRLYHVPKRSWPTSN